MEKEINYLKEYIKGEIVFNIETLVNDDYVPEAHKEKLYNINDETIDDIADAILDNDWLFDNINFVMNEAIQDELSEVIENE